MKKLIIVGIPSYNEEKTIGFVTQQIDAGLRKFFPHFNCYLINIDSNSEDKTVEKFLNTKTFFPKIFIKPRGLIKGKGKNLLSLFRYSLKLGGDFVAIFDSDLKSITPDWIGKLLSPLIYEDYNYVVPLYCRSCYDGNVTNHFIYPLTYALFRTKLRQPIGGEFSLDKKFYSFIVIACNARFDAKGWINFFSNQISVNNWCK